MGGCASKPKNVMDGNVGQNAPIEIPANVVDATTAAQATTESGENVEMNNTEDPSVDLAKLNPSEVAVEAVNDASEPKTAATEVRELIADADTEVNEVKTSDTLEVGELKTNTMEIDDTTAQEKQSTS